MQLRVTVWAWLLAPLALVGNALAEWNDCRCARQIDNVTGCCGDEELHVGLCYKKCSLLTDGRYSYRSATNTCCNTENYADCLFFMNTESRGFGCSGYGVDRDGECAALPCQHSGFAGGDVLWNDTRSSAGKWLYDLQFEIPHVTEWGPIVNIDGGSCTRLKLGHIEATSVGTPAVPEIDYRISKIRLQCRLIMRGNTLKVNFGFADSDVSVRVAVQPFQTDRPDIALPLGPVSMTFCAVQGKLSYVDFEGDDLQEPELKLLRSNIMQVLDQDGSYLACKQLEPLVAQKASLVLAHFASALEPLLSVPLPPSPPVPLAELVDWATYPPLRLVSVLLNERREMMAEIGQRLSPLRIPAAYNISRRSGETQTNIIVRGVQVEGLESLLNHGVDVVGSGNWLDIAASFHHLRLIVSAEVVMNLAVDELKLVAERPLTKNFNVTVDMSKPAVGVRMLAMLSRPALDSLHVDQLQQPGCLASCAQEAVPSEAPIAMQQVTLGRSEDMKFSDLAALSVGMSGWMEADVAQAIDTTTNALLHGYLPSIEAMIPGAIEFVRPKLDDAVQEFMSGLPPCRPTATYEGPGDLVTGLLLYGSLGLTIAAIAVGLCGMIGTCGKSARAKPAELSVEDVEDLCDCSGQPLSSSSVVPHGASVVFLVLVVATFMLFLYADLGLGTVINVEVTADGSAVTIGPAFAFSLISCAVSAWQSQAYCIAALIALLSGVWPLVKLALLLLAWLVPVEKLGLEARERLLTFLDTYGKYSLIDSWLAILALATYRISWESESADVGLVVNPVPMMPFFAFVVATVLSLGLGHAASEMHRQDTEDVTPEGSASDEVVTRLSRHAKSDVALTMTVSLAVSEVLLIVGGLVASFRVTTSGILTSLMLDPPAMTHSYSLVELALHIKTGKPHDGWLMLVQAIFLTFTYAIPLTLNLVLLFLWQCPLRRRSQRKVLLLCKMLDSWASFDVFALALLVSHFEFGRMATFLVYHDNIASLCGWVLGRLQEDCFHIECYLTPGFVLVAIAALASYAVPKAAVSACFVAMERHSEKRGLLEDLANSDVTSQEEDGDGDSSASSHE